MVMADSSIIVLAFIFAISLIFTLMGFTLQFPRNIIGFIISGVLWFVLGTFVPIVEATYPFLGWAFIILGMCCVVFGSVEGVSALYEVYSQEEWEKEEGLE